MKCNRLVLILAIALLPALAGAENDARFALVIGNADYEGDAVLKNPANDASDMAAALREIGWNVQLVQNADRRTFARAVTAFRDTLASSASTTALFYYAGHAMQADGQNYLLPVKTAFETIDDIKIDAMNLTLVTEAIQQGGAQVSLLILDSCRNNPFAKKMTRSLGGTRGLTVVQTAGGAKGSAIVFSTSPGDVAQDGEGRNGVFTAALLKHIGEDVPIETVIKSVNAEVRQATEDAQKPWINASLSSDVYFVSEAIRNAKAAAASKASEEARQAELARVAESARQSAAAAQAGPAGKVRIESFAKGKVYVGEEFLGDIEPDFPLIADKLKTGDQSFRLVSPGSPDETKTATVTDKAYVTVVFGRKPAAAAAGTQAGLSGASGDSELFQKAFLKLMNMDTGSLRGMDPFSQDIHSLSPGEKSRLFDLLRKQDALGSAALNLVPCIGLGSFMQGNVGYGWYQVGSTIGAIGAFIGAMLYSGYNPNPGPEMIIPLAFFANFFVSYAGGLIAPWIYEADYNQALRKMLLADTEKK